MVNARQVLPDWGQLFFGRTLNYSMNPFATGSVCDTNSRLLLVIFF